MQPESSSTVKLTLLSLLVMKKIVFFLIASLFVAGASHASLIDPVHIDNGSVISGGGIAEATWIEVQKSLPAGYLTYLNKYDEEDAEFENTGALGDSYFGIQNLGPNSVEIMWDLAGSGYQLSYVLLKSGRSFYSLYSVAADQVINSGGWEEATNNVNNAISHISFFGKAAPVPDSGATLALLGLALAALGVLRRRK